MGDQLVKATGLDPARLHVGLLGCAVQESFGGINYVLNLVRALRALPEGECPRLTLFVDPLGPNPTAFAPAQPLVETVASLAGPLTNQRRVLGRLGNIIGRFVGNWAYEVRWAGQRAGCGVLFPTSISLGRGRPTWIGWAYDLQHLHHPEFFSRIDLWRREYYFSLLARHAPRIVVSSQTAHADWLRRFPESSGRVTVLSFTSVPLDDWCSASPDGVIRRLCLPHKFLLLPNQFWIHKNHSTAFEAVRLLRERGLEVTLACTGATEDARRPGYFPELQRWIARHNLADRIRILGLLPATEQIQLLRACAAVVQPSLFEGWSTVVEEARALGKIVYLSDIVVHREQDPPGARYFPPRDSAALADLIAAEWERLAPGPQIEREREARSAHQARVAQYARTFIAIARDALTARSAA